MNIMDGWSCIVLGQFVIDENIQFNGCWGAEDCLRGTKLDIVKSYVIICKSEDNTCYVLPSQQFTIDHIVCDSHSGDMVNFTPNTDNVNHT